MYYVSKLAKNYVKVLLSGEGGDEAFAGYSNYRNILWLERLKHVLPALNGAASWGLSGVNSWFHSARVAKYAPLMSATFPDYYYSRTSSPYRYSGNGMGELYSADFESRSTGNIRLSRSQKLFSKVKDQGILDQMLYIDTKTWLPDDLLIKADKMTMANSLELRVPLLDHRVLEFAASLPAHYKLRGFSLKYILKRALSKRVPTAILKRKKAGFPVPYESWMRGDLKDWLNGILLDRETSARGYFRKSTVEKLLSENASSGRYSKELFSLAVLELWHRQFLGDERPSVPVSPEPSLTRA